MEGGREVEGKEKKEVNDVYYEVLQWTKKY